jgi:hypothetical protein
MPFNFFHRPTLDGKNLTQAMVQVEGFAGKMNPVRQHGPAGLIPEVIAGHEVKVSQFDRSAPCHRFQQRLAPHGIIELIALGKVALFVPGGRVPIETASQQIDVEVFDHSKLAQCQCYDRAYQCQERLFTLRPPIQ